MLDREMNKLLDIGMSDAPRGTLAYTSSWFIQLKFTLKRIPDIISQTNCNTYIV